MVVGYKHTKDRCYKHAMGQGCKHVMILGYKLVLVVLRLKTSHRSELETHYALHVIYMIWFCVTNAPWL